MVYFSEKTQKSRSMNKLLDKVFTHFLWYLSILILTIIVYILFKILSKGLFHINLKFLLGLPSEIDAGGGIGPFLFNSFYVLIISLIISLPVGIGAGIYLSEFAPKNRITEMIRTSIESLASVPSIVFGLFGYVLFVDVFHIGLTILGAGITLSLLNLPVITSVTEEAIQAVPRELREAAYSLGLTDSQVILSTIIPAALPGIMTGISLAACRAFGESAIILLAGGTGTSGKMWDFNPLSEGGTLPVHLWYVQSEALVEDAQQIAQKSGSVLIIIVLLMSLTIRIPVWLKNRKLFKR
ncbi:phosphate ABC transporter, permease protein PstA [Bacillus sp. MUM 116]|uniref:phosphate ABC transporter permease PstA n=1 Tax=Bacillus sp. MUM 116 TaxID=1678002 RepID=UPI0008F5A872|nr:phosphate ABC transporter permease PstA [Bacillus sp. MUM 116]OIK16348.1 phosphate ABC transporter, permease protein PstA [Bacillus sp. MUM 116]